MQQDDETKTRIDDLMEKCERKGIRSLSRPEFSELFLSLATGLNDSRTILKDLLAIKNESIFGLSGEALSKGGVNEAGAFLIGKFDDIAAYISSINDSEPEVKEYDPVAAEEQWQYLEDLIRKQFSGIGHEKALMILFNSDANIIYMDFLNSGSNYALVLDIPKICSICTEKSACYCIIAHNHPSGIAQPSRADCTATLKLYEALNIIGVILLDHYIITSCECTSIRDTFNYFDPTKTGKKK